MKEHRVQTPDQPIFQGNFQELPKESSVELDITEAPVQIVLGVVEGNKPHLQSLVLLIGSNFDIKQAQKFTLNNLASQNIKETQSSIGVLAYIDSGRPDPFYLGYFLLPERQRVHIGRESQDNFFRKEFVVALQGLTVMSRNHLYLGCRVQEGRIYAVVETQKTTNGTYVRHATRQAEASQTGIFTKAQDTEDITTTGSFPVPNSESDKQGGSDVSGIFKFKKF